MSSKFYDSEREPVEVARPEPGEPPGVGEDRGAESGGADDWNGRIDIAAPCELSTSGATSRPVGTSPSRSTSRRAPSGSTTSSRRYGESLTLVLPGHVVDTDLSDTLSRVHETTQATVTDLSLSAPEGTEDESSARLRLATEENECRATLAAVREIADEKGLRVIEPLAGGDQ